MFPFNEPVEAMDYDRAKCRLIVSSHTGKINMFSVEKNGKIEYSKPQRPKTNDVGRIIGPALAEGSQ